MDETGAVAIIGMSCRFAGCETLEEFWRILYNGENYVREIPPEKFNLEAFFAPNFEEPGKTYCRWAAMIDKPYEFDNVVFGINEMEAAVLDPQQRLALEVSYKAIENAGIPLNKMKGSNTAVYMCQMNEDYARHLGTDFSTWRNYEFTGSHSAILSNRLSYTYDLRGPSVTVDTACSGAMVAVHMGIHSILSGESNMALCGGSNFMIGPTTLIALSKSRMATVSGQCHAFSDNPDGYVKGEGSGIVLLKRLDKALQDNDRIWGILKTSICSDGRAETPITSPSRDQLKVLIDDVVRKAKINPANIQYVECHGTGTASGDPCEAWGVGNTYGVATKKEGRPPVPIGSVKTNIGHTESSAGTAGLIKVLLQLYHGTLVPSLHAERLNPTIDFEGMNVTVSRERRSIGYADEDKKIRLMGINSNGFGGTAVHGIVQMKEELAKPHIPETSRNCKLPLVFSALNEQGLRASLEDTHLAIKENKIPSFLQLSNTSTLKRTHHNVRYTIFPENLDGASHMIKTALKSKENVGKKIHDKGNNIIFAFCGMGSHWINMGLSMYEEDATFKQTIDKIQSELDKFDIEINLLHCFAGVCDLKNPLYGQPAIFGVQVGLFETLKTRGINPDVILGHSVGEVAAAYASGYLSFESAVKVIYERGRVLSSTKGGSMLVVGKLAVRHVEELLQQMKLDVDIAALNSPTSCTLSGDTNSITNIKIALEKKFGDGIFLRLLDVEVAYHSKYMDTVLQELGESLEGLISENDRTTKLVSTVSGKEVIKNECSSPTYWKDNLRKGVQFHKSFLKTLSTTEHNVIIEIGPKPVLRSYIKEIAAETKYILLASMLDKSGYGQIEQVITQCFHAGVNLNWESYFSSPCPVGIYPRYIYQRKYMFEEPEVSIRWRSGLCTQNEIYGGVTIKAHPFVSEPQKDAPKGSIRCSAKLSSTTTPFVFEHKLDGMILAPGATHPELGLAALNSHLKEPIITGRDNITIDVKFNRPVTVVNEKDEREVMVTLFPLEDPQIKGDSYQFDVTSDEVLHATGNITINQKNPNTNSGTLCIKDLRKRCTDSFSLDTLYSKLADQKFTYGSSLKWGIKGWKNDQENLLQMEVPKTENLRQTLLHPVWIDTLFQMFALVQKEKTQEQMIPVRINKISILQNQEFIRWAYVKVESINNVDIILNGYLLDNKGGVVAKCEGMQISKVGVESTVSPIDLMVEMSWKPFEQEKHVSSKAGIILFSESSMVLANEIKKWNTPVYSVTKGMEMVKDITEGNTEKCFPENLSEYEHIIYSWSLDAYLSEEMDGNSATNSVLEECMLLLQIFKMNQDLSKPLTIHVLVNGVHALMNKEKILFEQGLQGCLGFAIAGMLRTIANEMTQQQYRLIDIDIEKSINLHTLRSVILEPPTESAEIAIIKGSLFTCHFQPPSKSIENNIKSVTLNELRCVQLTRAHDETNDNMVIQLQQCGNTDINVSTSNVRVQLQRFFFTSTWQKNKKVPTEIMCMDSVGSTTNGKKVVIFHPVHVTTGTVSVPSSACIPFSTFPTDVPCFSFWVSAWNMLQQIKISSKWEIVAQQKDDPHVMALQYLCTMMMGKKNCGLKNARSVILCITKAEDFQTSLQNILDSNAEYVTIIAKNSETSKEVLLTHTDKLSEIPHANVLSFDSLYNISLTKIIEKFKSWIEKQNSKKFQNMIDTYSEIFSKKNPLVTLRDVIESRVIEEDAIISLSCKENELLQFEVTTNTLFRKEASYLVFGGSKGLGWEIVKHMAVNGAGRIGIVSRSGISRAAWKNLHDLENKHKCSFEELLADVTDKEKIHNVLSSFTSLKPDLPVKGIFFGAVSLHDCTMMNMTEDIFRKVLAPKVTGAWNLLQLSKNLDLDYFVLHSSIISMYGNVGQTNYAAANGFLDGLAHYRRILYGQGQAICWGALDLGLLENNDIAKRKLAARGILTLKLQEILQCFNHALVHNACWAGYSKFNFPKLIKETSILMPAAQNIYKWVFTNKGHYMKRPDNTGSRKTGQSGSTTSYVKGLVQSLTMADEGDIPSDSTLDALGIDSQQLTIFLSTIIKDYGKITNLNILDLATMSINDITARLPGGKNNNVVEISKLHMKEYDISDDTLTMTTMERPNSTDKRKTSHVNTSETLPSKDYEYTESSKVQNSMRKASVPQHKAIRHLPLDIMKQGKYFKAEGERTKHLQLKTKKDTFVLEIKSRGMEPTKIDVNDVSDIAIMTKKGKNSTDIHEMTIVHDQRNIDLTSVYSENLQLLTDWKDSFMSLKVNKSDNITFSEAKTCHIM